MKRQLGIDQKVDNGPAGSPGDSLPPSEISMPSSLRVGQNSYHSLGLEPLDWESL